MYPGGLEYVSERLLLAMFAFTCQTLAATAALLKEQAEAVWEHVPVFTEALWTGQTRGAVRNRREDLHAQAIFWVRVFCGGRESFGI